MIVSKKQILVRYYQTTRFYRNTTTLFCFNSDSRFGFRCLCTGYEDTPLTSQRLGLAALEMELVYAGGNSASKLLAPDLDVPPMVYCELPLNIYPV